MCSVLICSTSPFSFLILLLNSFPSMHRKSSPGWMMPHLIAIARAVLMLSPVTIRTVIPARWHFRMASGTCRHKFEQQALIPDTPPRSAPEERLAQRPLQTASPRLEPSAAVNENTAAKHTGSSQLSWFRFQMSQWNKWALIRRNSKGSCANYAVLEVISHATKDKITHFPAEKSDQVQSNKPLKPAKRP